MGLLSKKKSKIWYSGDVKSWHKAFLRSGGYSDPSIIEKVLSSTIEVIKGKATYEQDSVLFHNSQIPSYLISAIMLSQNNSAEDFKVLDWGGSLGSLYFRTRPLWLNSENKTKWHVVEQDNFVSLAEGNVELDNLFFHKVTPDENFDLCILSAVLQYLEDPYIVLSDILGKSPRYVLVSRTAFIKKAGKERITIQEVFPPIYEATYPCRFLDESKIMNIFLDHNYEVIFNEIDGDACPNIRRSCYRHILACRKSK